MDRPKIYRLPPLSSNIFRRLGCALYASVGNIPCGTTDISEKLFGGGTLRRQRVTKFPSSGRYAILSITNEWLVSGKGQGWKYKSRSQSENLSSERLLCYGRFSWCYSLFGIYGIYLVYWNIYSADILHHVCSCPFLSSLHVYSPLNFSENTFSRSVSNSVSCSHITRMQRIIKHGDAFF